MIWPVVPITHCTVGPSPGLAGGTISCSSLSSRISKPPLEHQFGLPTVGPIPSQTRVSSLTPPAPSAYRTRISPPAPSLTHSRSPSRLPVSSAPDPQASVLCPAYVSQKSPRTALRWDRQSTPPHPPAESASTPCATTAIPSLRRSPCQTPTCCA